MGSKGPIQGARTYTPDPFKGGPPLGSRPDGKTWPKQTREWWRSVSSMPHAADFTAEDWDLARFAALTHARVLEGDVARAGEFRLQCKALGVGLEARTRLGIVYEEAAPTPKPRRTRDDLKLVGGS